MPLFDSAPPLPACLVRATVKRARQDARLTPCAAQSAGLRRYLDAAAAHLPHPRAIGLALALSAGLLAACAKPVEPVMLAKPVRVQQITLAAAATDESYTGEVRARVESDVAFRVGGKVARREVEVGQRVRSGDVLARLDAQDYALGVSAALNQRQAAAVEAEQAAADAARFAKLAGQGFVSQAEAQRYRSRADAARERLEQATREAELARNREGYAALRAPFDGVVTALHIEVGQVVAEGQPVATLAALGEREIVIDIPESRVVQAKRTPAARASLWAGDGQRFVVTLRELSPIASSLTRTFRARYSIGVDAPPTELGMTATVWLGTEAAGDARPVATLPASALHHADGEPAVWIVAADQGTPILAPVQVVRYGQDEVQVSGLRDGQLVVTAGVQKLAAGMRVVAVNDDGQPVAAHAREHPPAAHSTATTLAAHSTPAR
jgi:RND family efflux transporter MFP subunit